MIFEGRCHVMPVRGRLQQGSTGRTLRAPYREARRCRVANGEKGTAARLLVQASRRRAQCRRAAWRPAWGSWRRGCGTSPSAPSSLASPSAGRRPPRLRTATRASRSSPPSPTPSSPAAPGTRLPVPRIPPCCGSLG
jgi:hypothetical protein